MRMAVSPLERLPLLALVLLDCGGAGHAGADAGPTPTELQCPGPVTPPFKLDDRAWRSDENEQNASVQPRIKHQPADLLGSPSAGFATTDRAGDAALTGGAEVVEGVMARIEDNRGLFAEPIPGEPVSLWSYRDAEGWSSLGQTVTATFADAEPGSYTFELGGPPPVGMTARYALLNPEGSCGTHYGFNLPAGYQVVVTDIDGTITASDDELLTQISDASYDPEEKPGSAPLMQTWASKGYLAVYLTARPHIFRSETRSWLDEHEYPVGPLITATDLVSGDAARAYKRAWLERIEKDFAWEIVAAYGNAISDIDAYEDAGLPKEITFIVGENAGASGTVGIDGDDFSAHVADFVEPQPDADQPSLP